MALIDWEQLLLLVGVAQGLIIGVYLLSKMKQRPANLVLAIIVVLASIQAFLFSLDEVYEYIGCALTNIYSRLIFLVYGPLFYLYTRQIVHPKRLWKWHDSLHFFPFILFSTISSWSYHTWIRDSGEGWIHYIANTHYFLPWLYDGLRLMYLVLYLAFSLWILYRYKILSQELFSDINKVQIKWLEQFLIAALVVWSIITLGIRFNYFSGNPNQEPFQFLFLVISIFLYWITYKAITDSVIFIELEEQLVRVTPANKYRNSGLKDDEASIVSVRLLQFMEDEKPYRDPDLRLAQLCDQLQISCYHLSQVLNKSMRQSFYAFVNDYRIEDAKKLLMDPDMAYLTVEAIAYDSGFNSKSTFINIFKKHTGMTPGNFRKLQIR